MYTGMMWDSAAAEGRVATAAVVGDGRGGRGLAIFICMRLY